MNHSIPKTAFSSLCCSNLHWFESNWKSRKLNILKYWKVFNYKIRVYISIFHKDRYQMHKHGKIFWRKIEKIWFWWKIMLKIFQYQSLVPFYHTFLIFDKNETIQYHWQWQLYLCKTELLVLNALALKYRKKLMLWFEHQISISLAHLLIKIHPVDCRLYF